MESAARVLLIGDEREHLQAKARILRHFWPVQLCGSRASRLEHLSAEVVVLCVTLGERAQQECVDRLRERTPALLIVKMNGYDSGPHAGADAIVDEARGPGALVSTIYELLTERSLPSRHWPQLAEGAWVQ